jgi:hypothetical protein
VSRAFPSCTWSILAEIYLCHACSHHEIEDGNKCLDRNSHLQVPVPTKLTVCATTLPQLLQQVAQQLRLPPDLAISLPVSSLFPPLGPSRASRAAHTGC